MLKFNQLGINRISQVSLSAGEKRSHIEKAITSILSFSGGSNKEEGTSEATLYNWRNALRQSGAIVPDSNTSSDQWSAQTKLAMVAETFSITEDELSQYCR